ncbi:MAG: hypothetical protein HGB15_02765 [Chlorobaculum sp.]|nr:hypothetical protein [Chlorobaculum sp.]
MKAKILLIGGMLSALAGADASAAVITMNPITGTNPNTSNPYTTGMTSDYTLLLTATGIGRGAGITGANANNTYSATGFANGAALVPANNDYFTFTITANPGYQIDFTNFAFNGQRNAAGPSSFVLRSSVDGYTSNIGAVITTSTSGTTYTIDLSATNFQNVGAITFRLYGYNATSPFGQYSINDYVLNGTAAAVPEPGAIALLGVGSLLMFVYLQRTPREADTVA